MSGPKRQPRGEQDLRSEALRFVGLSIVVSLTMLALKLGLGMFSGSHALLANAIYSINDVLSSIGVAVSLHLRGRRANARYPYGYGKAEFIAAGLVSVTVAAFVCFMVAYSLFAMVKGGHEKPHVTALPLAALSAVVSWYIARRAHDLSSELSSPALETSAEHFHSDASGSAAAIVGIAGALVGFAILDPVVAIFEELHLMALSGTLLAKSTKGLMDEALPHDDTQLLREACGAVDGVRGVTDLRTRRVGSKTWVDVGVEVPGRLKVSQAHEIAGRVTRAARDVLGPTVMTQVRIQGPNFVPSPPGPGGSEHAA